MKFGFDFAYDQKSTSLLYELSEHIYYYKNNFWYISNYV